MSPQFAQRGFANEGKLRRLLLTQGKINGCISNSSHSPLIFTAVNESLLILSGWIISVSFIEVF